MAETLNGKGYQYVHDEHGEVKCVGKGSFGKAMLVKDSHGQVFVAKELNLHQMSKKDRRSAENEVKLLQQVDHPFIIKFVDSFVDPEGKMYIIMEYADGGDLAQRIKVQRKRRMHFTERQIMIWFTQLCLALDHLHEKKILHRDLKTMSRQPFLFCFLLPENACLPPNVFLTSNNIVKLGDFGFSKRLKTAAMAHTVCGTPYYFSPELCQGQAYSNKSDIWSLGVILYEMAMLSRPYEADSMQELMKKIVYGQYTQPDPDCPVRISRLIFYMLSKKDSVRPSVTKLLLNSYVQSYVNEMPKFLKVTTDDSRYPKELGHDDKAPEAPAAATAANEDAGAQLNDKEPLKESQACTPEEMKVLTGQLSAIPAAEKPPVQPEVHKEEPAPPEEPTPGENDVFEDQYESDFEEYHEEESAEKKRQDKREKLEKELGADKFASACKILQEMGDNEEAAGKALEALLSEAEQRLAPELNAYVIETMRQEMAPK